MRRGRDRSRDAAGDLVEQLRDLRRRLVDRHVRDMCAGLGIDELERAVKPRAGLVDRARDHVARVERDDRASPIDLRIERDALEPDPLDLRHQVREQVRDHRAARRLDAIARHVDGDWRDRDRSHRRDDRLHDARGRRPAHELPGTRRDRDHGDRDRDQRPVPACTWRRRGWHRVLAHQPARDLVERWSRCRIALQHPLHEVAELVVQLRRRPVDHLRHDFDQQSALVRPTPAEAFVEHDAEAVDVARLGRSFSEQHLRRHVRGRSEHRLRARAHDRVGTVIRRHRLAQDLDDLRRRDRARPRRVVRARVFEPARDSEIDDLHLAGAPDDDVLRLDVAMQDSGAVCCRDRRCDLRADREERASLDAVLQQLAQRPPRQILHRDEVLAVVLADLVDRHDARVIQRRQRLRFVAQRALRGVASQQLQRDVALERRISREEDLTHPAVAEQAHDLIAADRVHRPNSIRRSRSSTSTGAHDSA